MAGSRVVPLSTVVFGGVLALTAFGAVRFQSRLFGFRRRRVEARRGYSARVLMGAGDAGEMVLKDILGSSLDRTGAGRDRR